MTATPPVGSAWIFSAPTALGAQVSNSQSAEMVELDLHPGTRVTICDFVEDSILIEWTDRQNNPRITAIEPARFDEQFTEGD